MAGIDAPALLAFAAGIAGTVHRNLGRGGRPGSRHLQPNSQVVPTSEFVAAYQAGERCLLQIRAWLSAMRRADARGTIVTARMFAVGAIMRFYLRSSVPAFTDDSELTSRLAPLSDVVAAQEYDFVGRIPRWLDEQFLVAKERWKA